MKILLAWAASTSSISGITAVALNNIQEKSEYALIDIRDKLPGGDLGSFTSKEAALEKMYQIIAPTGYMVIIDDSKPNLFILEGDINAGYSGYSFYEYKISLIDIKDKLPGGDLGYFNSKTEARTALNLLISQSNYYVSVDDSNDTSFIVTGIQAAGFTGQVTYTWNLSLVDITGILGRDKNIGRFLDINGALNYTEVKLKLHNLTMMDVNISLERINDRNGYIVISGRPEQGFTGTVRWKTGTFLKDIALILIDESPFLPVSNAREAKVILNNMVNEYGMYNDVAIVELGPKTIQVRWKFLPIKYTGFKTFYWN